MFLTTMTIDQFKQLTPDDHQLAVGVYDQAIHTLAQGLSNPTDSPDEYEEDAAEPTSLITLRKLHVGALDELTSAGESNGAPVAAAA